MSTTLAPERTSRTPLGALTTPATHEALVRIDAAITRHFPENLFADLDLVAAELAARTDPLALADRIVRVHALFGQETPLRFRYAHDFLYGFDWARWVARDPKARSGIGPYDEAFLDYSEQRAAELRALVAEGDPKYGPIASGHRNPFPFRRDPASEHALHRALAVAGDIPVAAWSSGTEPVWERPYGELRESKARELGLLLSG